MVEREPKAKQYQNIKYKTFKKLEIEFGMRGLRAAIFTRKNKDHAFRTLIFFDSFKEDGELFASNLRKLLHKVEE